MTSGECVAALPSTPSPLIIRYCSECGVKTLIVRAEGRCASSAKSSVRMTVLLDFQCIQCVMTCVANVQYIHQRMIESNDCSFKSQFLGYDDLTPLLSPGSLPSFLPGVFQVLISVRMVARYYAIRTAPKNP